MRLSPFWLATAVLSAVGVLLVISQRTPSEENPTFACPTSSSATEIRRRDRRQVDTYYDFLINEWSFKFWAVFQLVTIAILLYSTFAAIYYAKYTYLHTQPTEEDIFFRKRSLDQAINRLNHGFIKYKPNSRNK